MFAPWAIYKEDFLAIGGHDPLYAPQSREDSDIFNRFLLAGYKPIQTWETFVYHLTCRGSRFNPQITKVGQASMEWLAHNRKSERNFTRKWGHMVRVDKNLKPIIPHKYDIVFITNNCSPDILDALEPWCSRIYCDVSKNKIENYIKKEQPNTLYNLSEKIFNLLENIEIKGDVIVKFDSKKLTQTGFQQFITQLSVILDQIKETGEYEFDIFKYDLRDKEITLLQEIRGLHIKTPQEKFYVIGTLKGQQRVLDHELAHAFWYLYSEYHRKMNILLQQMNRELKNIATSSLMNMGYCENMILDEIQAYLSTTTKRNKLLEIFKWEKIDKVKIPSNFKKLFKEFKLSHK
jgi:hypothetical protein